MIEFQVPDLMAKADDGLLGTPKKAKIQICSSMNAADRRVRKVMAVSSIRKVRAVKRGTLSVKCIDAAGQCHDST